MRDTIRVTVALACLIAPGRGPAEEAQVRLFRSTEDRQLQLQAVAPRSDATPESTRDAILTIDLAQPRQRILGFGASFDHASCSNLMRLDTATRNQVLHRLFDREQGLGMNLMRVCIGTSDFTGEDWYTYHDLPAGETDESLAKFSIEKDRAYILPVIQEARRRNPELLCYASPWSPPAWMKTHQSLLGGRMDPRFHDAYARYFVKFIEAYRAEGIPIHAVTVQNEPFFPNPKYPTCEWSAEELHVFIRDHLGPQLREAKLDVAIWCWDHNWNRLEVPRRILSDPVAADFVAGTAFHHYEGQVEAQSQLHSEFPNKEIFFTEGSTFGVAGGRQIARILGNWSRSYNFWVFLLDEHRKPNRGPHAASATPVELLDDGTVRYNFEYFMYGQYMRFIRRDAIVMDVTSTEDGVTAIAFENPGSERVLVVTHEGTRDVPVRVTAGQMEFRDVLPGRSVSTYLWPANR